MHDYIEQKRHNKKMKEQARQFAQESDNKIKERVYGIDTSTWPDKPGLISSNPGPSEMEEIAEVVCNDKMLDRYEKNNFPKFLKEQLWAKRSIEYKILPKKGSRKRLRKTCEIEAETKKLLEKLSSVQPYYKERKRPEEKVVRQIDTIEEVPTATPMMPAVEQSKTLTLEDYLT